MVYGFLKYYELYVLLLPYFIFWLAYVSYLIFFLYSLYFIKFYTFYFPEDSEWLIINFLLILPMRIAFNSIYYVRGFSLKSFVFILYSISIILIIGLPFISIKIILMYIRVKNIYDVWDELSTYNNIKLLIRNGKLIRNMKKMVDKGKIFNEVVSKAGYIEQGLLKTGDFYHAVSHVEGCGVMYTTKNQKDISSTLINKTGGTLVYVQCFGNNEIINMDTMKNKDLLSILKMRGSADAVYANLHILNISNCKIILNDKNRQFLNKIENINLERSKKFVLKCGGIEKIHDAFDYNNYKNSLLIDAQKLLFQLANAKSSSKYDIYMKGRNIINILNELERERQLDEELMTIKNAIEKIII